MARPPDPPLYDPRFDHDACGVGFVADAGGRSGRQVLALALTGLAALRHRGAVGADGESSDGAGVLLPLTASVRRMLAPRSPHGSAVVFAQLPRRRQERDRAAGLVERSLRREGLPAPTWRDVPVRPGTLGPAARGRRPHLAQAVVDRPAGWSATRFELALIVARRRIEHGARSPDLADLAIASASSRTVVYKALVAGDRLAEFYPDLARPLDIPFALFHQRFATNTRPTWQLAQPFRRLAHNGEIDTVRGNREQVRGRVHDLVRSAAGRRLVETGPLLSPDGSDSLSLDECLELLVATGWRIDAALASLVPDAPALRRVALGLPGSEPEHLLAPWDGPGAFVFADGRRVGALVDRNGLRPLAYAVTRSRLVVAASEAGAIPLDPSETVRIGRLGPGELLVVEPGRGRVLEDAEAKRDLRRSVLPVEPPVAESSTFARPTSPTPLALRSLAGLDAERQRLAIRTMALEGHEPLWSMGDDTPTPALGRVTRPVADHLRQAFAQVTNPPIDPERERAVIDLTVEVGRRPPLLGGPPRPVRDARGPRERVALGRPIVADIAPVLDRLPPRSVRWLDATWPSTTGPAGLERRLAWLASAAVRAADRGARVVALSDRSFSLERLPVPSVLAVGAVHTALTNAGLRGRTDVVVEASDVLDVHAAAMALASGATAAVPWLAVEVADEQAGTRGAEEVTAERAVVALLDAFEAGLRKVLARMGISAAASYVGGALFETIELHPTVVDCCFPAAPGWPGSVGFEDLARRQLARRADAIALASSAAARLPDRGLARYRGDGERHLYAPPIVAAIQRLAQERAETPAEVSALADYRASLARPRAVVRDSLVVRRRRRADRVPLDDVEPARAIVGRFVASAMSVGALSPEAHRAITIGMQRAGGSANTGEGGEDPAWYAPAEDGGRADAAIKQVASARFGVTATYLARAEQLEIKIAQGSKPGEGGQLPGRKATAYIAALRRAQPGQSLISPPPHHDIYSIEDLAQLITDLRAINPTARIGVKLVAARGIGTIGAGVAKAGADYVHVAGHAGGTGASPLSSIKHVGSPWELGLAEVHQVLVRNGLRERVVLRTDGGLQTGRDIVLAALLGAEEVAFGTPLLVAVGCDMARQCHLDTCPTGIATQREDLRAKFAGSPEAVERFVTRLAEDVRAELAVLGARTFGEIVGQGARHLRVADGATLDLGAVVDGSRWVAPIERRNDRSLARRGIERAVASASEERLLRRLDEVRRSSAVGVELSTADRSFGAALAGALERGRVVAPVVVQATGSAGQSLGAFLPAGLTVELAGQANDYVGKGLSGGRVMVRPPAGLAAAHPTLVGNTCLYGATAGRLHVVGRAGMRFAVRNSGADAVVEGLGAHGCEYMTGGTVVVLGPVGPNFGAGMTGGRAYLLDPHGRQAGRIHGESVVAERLSVALRARADAAELVAGLRALLEDHAAVGSAIAADLLRRGLPLDEFWLIQPVGAGAAAADASRESEARRA
ncbi:MAG TPA: glutamate synthase large subunit [Candidatus Limnocylindrales bacterium]|nr:glutamate synthase large subunit [Candidatus Limnocylindrales bacterium]